MKRLLAAICLMIGVAQCLNVVPQHIGRSSTVDKRIAFTEKLALLKSCGIKVALPFSEEDLMVSISPADKEEPSLDLILSSLASEDEQEPARPFSTNVWHFDPECVVQDGDYVAIARRLVEMTGGSLKVDDIRDRIDDRRKIAWLSFVFKGQRITMNLKFQDDWADPKVLKKFVQLLKQSDTSKSFYAYEEDGCVIACLTKAEAECLRSHGVNFSPMY